MEDRDDQAADQKETDAQEANPKRKRQERTPGKKTTSKTQEPSKQNDKPTNRQTSKQTNRQTNERTDG